MAFFEASPAAEDPEPERRPDPAWWAPPRDELPVPVAAGRVLARASNAVLNLRRLDVYSNGVVFCVRVDARRDRSLPEESWFDVIEALHPMRRAHAADSGLRLGVTFSDGTATTAGHGPRPDDGSHIVGPVLTIGGGGGGGSDEHYDTSYRVWLWPLPPRGPLTLHFAWAALGIGEGSTTFDAGKVVDAASTVGSLWE